MGAAKKQRTVEYLQQQGQIEIAKLVRKIVEEVEEKREEKKKSEEAKSDENK